MWIIKPVTQRKKLTASISWPLTNLVTTRNRARDDLRKNRFEQETEMQSLAPESPANSKASLLGLVSKVWEKDVQKWPKLLLLIKLLQIFLHWEFWKQSKTLKYILNEVLYFGQSNDLPRYVALLRSQRPPPPHKIPSLKKIRRFFHQQTLLSPEKKCALQYPFLRRSAPTDSQFAE